MTIPVFLVEDLPAGERFELGGAEGRHAAAARRIGAGERLVVTDGAGGWLTCVVTGAGRDSLSLLVEERAAVPAASPRTVVVQALAKGDRGELAVAMLTEAGVDEIVPWSASRSVTVWRAERGEKSLAKWRATARESAKQSRRAWLPVVRPLATTAAVASLLSEAVAAYVLHEEATEPLAAAKPPADGLVALVVGPEGGIAPDELTAFTAAGATPVRLGSSVLRTSTAGVAALSVVNALTSRWS
ncbi:16S rRNA (uracil(1498)-N(3))-methyltransferase [Fodinicola acaciae]|uniref:16S rRNA (uracil(1498)-N(3))-methyltransferase n=1 Tax=Fodinicola acaciae TaxID=2681555 RepID=UPI0013D70D40|nr:16S rRNA (uracil(1498)-N(3))-methyltransferase [Fodinicola acaciae]